MIVMREVLVRPGIIDSERVCALSLACQLFFRNLLHCCDGRGRFPADADDIRSALYRRASGVSVPHVEAWLQKIADARLVKIYTRDGKRFGEVVNYGQRDSSRRALYPPPAGQEEFNLLADDPPKPTRPKRPPARGKEWNRIEGEGEMAPEGARPPAPVKFSHEESEEAWIARLARDWPACDVREELRVALISKQRSGRKLERGWFERSWLPNTSPAVSVAGGAKPAATVAPDPEAWRRYLKDEFEGESWAESAAACAWAGLPANWREKIAREMDRKQPE